jgi:hypothetical protein
VQQSMSHTPWSQFFFFVFLQTIKCFWSINQEKKCDDAHTKRGITVKKTQATMQWLFYIFIDCCKLFILLIFSLYFDTFWVLLLQKILKLNVQFARLHHF